MRLLRRLNPSAVRKSIPVAEGVGNSDEANWADEFAAFFNRGADLDTTIEGAQNINVHTLAVTGASSDGNYPNFIRWIAKEGGGIYQAASNTDGIIQGMTKILNQIRAANSVFAAASLPVSANTQGTYLNQVYIGMFRPDGNALPRWVGNLKQYQFVYNASTNSLKLADATLVPAVSPTTGFIDNDATSFWTTSSSFWLNVETASGGSYSRSDAPDGELVEKGGIAQYLRQTYYCELARPARSTRASAAALRQPTHRPAATVAGNSYRFSTANTSLTPTLFGFAAAETAKRDLLVNWIRGDDNVTATNVANESVAKDQLGLRPTGATVRPSIHGDVLHSRPVAINYGGTRGVVVYYGANDGMLRAINGNQTGTGAGSELWSFVAPEHFATLNRMRENDPQVRYPSTPSAVAGASPRNYYVRRSDRCLSEHDDERGAVVPGNETRRARGICIQRHAIRTSRVCSGASTTRWPITHRSVRHGRCRGYARIKGSTDPVLIMGGGYDAAAEDASPAGATTIGRGVYVINMRTGARLGWLATDYSVPADVSIVDSDGDGFVDRVYVVDVARPAVSNRY